MTEPPQNLMAASQFGEAPRRILMTADTVGGVWTYALELARGLSKYGIEVALATMGQAPSAGQRREAARIQNITLFESTFRLEWMENPWEEIERAGEWLLSLADRFRPDLVHLNGYVHASLPWSCPSLVVAHSCVLSWWEAVRKKEAPPELQHYKERVARGLASAGLVAAPTSAMLQSVQEFYLPLANGRVIHNARSGRKLRPGKKQDFILSVGRIWDDAKNIGSIAKMAHSLPWLVFVAGEEKHPEGKGTAIVDNVIRLGTLPSGKLASWFGTASVYALPARYEPFGLTVLEAAMCGCALVLGDIPSLRELWEGAAILVPPDDTEALARELRTLCTDRLYLDKMAGKALERSRIFTPDRMAAEYLSAYLSLDPGFSGRPSYKS